MRYIKQVVLIVSCITILFLFISISSNNAAQAHPEEIAQILATEKPDERVTYYRALIERVGLEKAQEYLYRSGLPFDGETHLLNHASGDYAYEKYGNEALLHCKEYFLASCYHGALIHIISNKGMDGILSSMELCYTQGSPVASQCAHAIGHGLVGWFGYAKLTAALEYCDSLGATDPQFPIFNCHDGAFMENLWGVHEDGELSEDRWIKSEDPYYPCSDERIQDFWQGGCWSNQASVMYQLFEGDIPKVATYCEDVGNEEYSRICFDSLARQIHPIAEGDFKKTHSYCQLTGGEHADDCLLTIVRADLSVGGEGLAYHICSYTLNQDFKRDCYRAITETAEAYNDSDSTSKERICSHILERKWRDWCLSYENALPSP